MFPTSLGGWTRDVIVELLTKGLSETEDFDFKFKLPDTRDDGEKEGLALDCCAFANSSGGSLVFGIKDAKDAKALERLEGLPPSHEFAEYFGNYPAACEPSVHWDFRNPPIELETGNVVQVVYIPRSWNAPHCLAVDTVGKGVKKVKGAKRFPKRTHKGNEEMSYDEIRLMFLQYYEKRLKLQLLRAELADIKQTSLALSVPQNEFATREPPAGEYRLSVIESVLADTYSILAPETVLLSMLTSTRRLCSQVNDKMRRWAAIAYMPMYSKEAIHTQHNESVTNLGYGIRTCCDTAIDTLDAILSKA